MKVLIDTNIIIDYIQNRLPESIYAEQILSECEKHNIYGYIAFHSVSIIWYVLRKIPIEQRRNILSDLLQIIKIAPADQQTVINAIQRQNFKDFEDCLQDESALNINADYIITNNIKDFIHAKIKPITSKEFIELISNM